jgi:hypothetical protein
VVDHSVKAAHGVFTYNVKGCGGAMEMLGFEIVGRVGPRKDERTD